MSHLQDRGDIEGIDLDVMDELNREVASSGSDVWKVEEGSTQIRIMPGVSKEEPVCKIFYKHIIDHPTEQNKKITAICPKMMTMKVPEKAPCIFCKFADALLRSGSQVNIARAELFQPQLKIACNIGIRNNEGVIDQVKVWEFGRSVWKKLNKILKANDGGDWSAPGPEGFDLIVDREGTGPLDTKYDVRPARNNCALSDNEEELSTLLDLRKSLLAWTAYPDTEELRQIASPVIDMDLLAPPSGRRAAGPVMAAPAARRPLAAGPAKAAAKPMPKPAPKPMGGKGPLIDVTPARGPIKRAQDKIMAPTDPSDDDVPL